LKKTSLHFQADDKFWRVKYDHEAAKKARKAKKAALRKKGSRPTASELMQLSDSSESQVTPEPLSPCCIHCLLLSALSILAH
jgi:hypothetical protein